MAGKTYVFLSPAVDDDEPLDHCLEQLHRNVLRLTANGEHNEDVVRRQNEYERFVRTFYELARRVQSHAISASLGRVPTEGKGEAAILIEIKGSAPGDGRTVVKCACRADERPGVGLLWAMKSLIRWAANDPERSQRVGLLRDSVCQQITDASEREAFEAKLLPNCDDDEWTYLRVFSSTGMNSVLTAIESFCAWVSG